MPINFDFKDPKNQRMLATFLVPIVALAAFYHFMIRPLNEQKAVTKTELAQVRQNVARLKQIFDKKNDLDREQTELTAKLGELESLLPEQDNIAVLLNQFSMVEKDANVYLVGFDSQQSIVDGDKPYRQNIYNLTFEAGYHQFATFVTKLMSLPRIMSFSELRITLNPLETITGESYEGLENQSRHLKIECVLTTYLYRKMSNESGG